MPNNPRYVLHAYVCGRSCVKLTSHLGAMTFHQIFVERPGDCRYAVAEAPAGFFMVWDLLGIQEFRINDGGFRAPRPVRETRDIDSAIVATAMLYDQ